MPVEKLLVHQKGHRHKAVSVFVINKGRILIQRRALGKYHTPGLWANTCCTHPEWDEPVLDCAVRRLNQELGIKGLYPTYRDTVEYRADVGDGLIEHEVVDIFTAEAPVNLPLTLNPDEVMDTKWIDFHDLVAEVRRKPATFTAWLQIYLEQHSDIIFGGSSLRR